MTTQTKWEVLENNFDEFGSRSWNISGRETVQGFNSKEACKIATVFCSEANARLIAAAPELLEACKRARLHIEAKYLDEAIAKAEGRA